MPGTPAPKISVDKTNGFLVQRIASFLVVQALDSLARIPEALEQIGDDGFRLIAAKAGTTRHVETRKQAIKAEETREISLFATKKTELV